MIILYNSAKNSIINSYFNFPALPAKDANALTRICSSKEERETMEYRQQELQEIFNKIYKRIEEGQYDTSYSIDDDIIVSHLRALGYQVEQYRDNKEVWEISWKNIVIPM